jgi:hypothetical protein
VVNSLDGELPLDLGKDVEIAPDELHEVPPRCQCRRDLDQSHLLDDRRPALDDLKKLARTLRTDSYGRA